jgi:outer membrane protein
VSVNQTIPVVYANATVKLPFTGLSANATGNGMSYKGSSITDLSAAVQYKLVDVPGFDFNVRAGYRQVHLKLDDVDNIDADVTFKGPFLGVQAHF